MITYVRTFFFLTYAPVPQHQVETLAEAIVTVQTTPSSDALRLGLSELTSSIPIGVTGRELARGQ